MLLGCCHCGSPPPPPPSESIPPSTSQSLPPSESITSVSEVTNSCIANSFGCPAIPRFLKFQVAVGGGNWDGSPDCLCSHYDGTYTLEFCECKGPTGDDTAVLTYSTSNLGWWRNNNLTPPGCRAKAAGDCVSRVGNSQGAAALSSRLYYAVIRPTGMSVVSSTYYTAYDFWPFERATITRSWKDDTANHLCLSNGPWTLPASARLAGLDGCSWGTGTLSVG